MNDGTRCLAMLTILVLTVSGCGAAQTSTVATARPSVPPSGGTAAPSVSASSATSASPAVPASPTVAEIARLEAAVTTNPSNGDAQRDLGFALLQRVRETADPTLYAPAAAAFDAARAITPDDAQVLVGIGGLELGKHQFAAALATGRSAVALSPNLPSARAVVVDALVELGRYDEADTAAGEMLATGSNLSTLARVSYLAELHGKLDVALTAMRMATKTPGLARENVAFVEVLLGNLLVYTGDSTSAADAYQRALALVPAHAPSVAGEGRLAVASGDLDTAIARFQRAADILPLPEYVLALADAQSTAGLKEAATRNEKLARAEIRLFQASGVVVDVDLALFEADHGDPTQALQYAEAGYKATPTVRAADALAWAFHRLGRDAEARRRSDEALRLGSRDPLLRYHAGAIAAALGDVKTARADLTLALSTDPGFSATGAAEARRIIAALPH